MKTKFNPEDVSKWCRWIAVDKNGECWEFSGKPLAFSAFEIWNNTQPIKYRLLYKGEPPKNWKEELYTWS